MHRRAAAVGAAAVVAVPAALAAPGGDAPDPRPPATAPAFAAAPAATERRSRERVRLGRPVRGRRIDAVRLGDPGARRTVLIVGTVHGGRARRVEADTADAAMERRVARLLGLPLRRLARYSGTAIAWQRSELPRTDALVVELGPSAPSPREADRVARALRRLAP